MARVTFCDKVGVSRNSLNAWLKKYGDEVIGEEYRSKGRKKAKRSHASLEMLPPSSSDSVTHRVMAKKRGGKRRKYTEEEKKEYVLRFYNSGDIISA